MSSLFLFAMVLAAAGLLVLFAIRQGVKNELQKREIDDLQKAKVLHEREREAKDAIHRAEFDDVLDFNDRLRKDRAE